MMPWRRILSHYRHIAQPCPPARGTAGGTPILDQDGGCCPAVGMPLLSPMPFPRMGNISSTMGMPFFHLLTAPSLREAASLPAWGISHSPHARHKHALCPHKTRRPPCRQGTEVCMGPSPRKARSPCAPHLYMCLQPTRHAAMRYPLGPRRKNMHAPLRACRFFFVTLQNISRRARNGKPVFTLTNK